MDKKIVLVLGPTASGKSDLALEISQATQAPIINADSIQIYQGLDIGSSAPNDEEKKRAPHHLYGFVKKGEVFTAAHYLKRVRDIFEGQPQQNQWVLCGGSGFYLQAIEKGMEPLSETTNEMKAAVADFIEQQGWAAAHAKVANVHGDKIHLNDQYRIRRALEVMEVRKQPDAVATTDALESPLKDFKTLKVGLRAGKEVLRPRVEQRIERMLRQGFVQEVQGLINEGLHDWPPLQSVGYFEVMEYLAGRLAQEELVEKITISTMQLIKKQMTWFKRDTEIQWFSLGEEKKALAVATEWLSSR